MDAGGAAAPARGGVIVDITVPFRLRSDVLLVPVRELDDSVRAGISGEEDDVALTRPRSRTTSTVVESAAARLIEQFRKPRTIVEAVILYARQQNVQPQDVLEDAYALVRRLLDAGFMLPADAAERDTEDAGPSLEAGTELDGGLRVIRAVYMLEDTELYMVRDAAGRSLALKIQRPDSDVRVLFVREARVLRALPPGIAPSLVQGGEWLDRPGLLMEWCRGIDAGSAAAEARFDASAAGHERLLTLLRTIAHAYTALHAAGVVHGDVHPRNILIAHDGAVRLIDFGFGRLLGEAPAPAHDRFARGGIPFFYEPEFAHAALIGAPLPPATPEGEQYALGALLYQLAAGADYTDFSMAREAMLREILERAPVPLSERLEFAWPALDAVLQRALAKMPEDRFASVAELAAALDAMDVPATATRGRNAGPALHVVSGLDAAGAEMLAGLSLDGPLFESGIDRAPTASLNYGAAGVAYALSRIAAQRDDPALLALADAWCLRAEHAATTGDGAFNAPDVDLTPATVGTASPFHSSSGVAAVRALLGRAWGDPVMQDTGARAFVAASRSGHKDLDLTLGRCSTILGAALLLDATAATVSPGLAEPGTPPSYDGATVPGDDAAARSARDLLLEAGRTQLEAVWRQLDTVPSIEHSGIGNLGIAHGWAGFIYSALRWHRTTGDALPAATESRLDELARLAEPAGRGIAWPWSLDGRSGPASTMPGWCNGTAGHVALWCLVHRTFGRSTDLERAVDAAWEMWEAPDEPGSLCCGLVGRAYALLDVHRLTGEDVWLERARELGERAARRGQFEPEFPHSLYKGRLSLALLAADLDRPAEAAHPFFGDEQWPAPEAAAKVTVY